MRNVCVVCVLRQPNSTYQFRKLRENRWREGKESLHSAAVIIRNHETWTNFTKLCSNSNDNGYPIPLHFCVGCFIRKIWIILRTLDDNYVHTYLLSFWLAVRYTSAPTECGNCYDNAVVVAWQDEQILLAKAWTWLERKIRRFSIDENENMGKGRIYWVE